VLRVTRDGVAFSVPSVQRGSLHRWPQDLLSTTPAATSTVGQSLAEDGLGDATEVAVSNKDHMRDELADKTLKVRNAQKAANAPGATDKDKADLKLLEQESVAQKLRTRRAVMLEGTEHAAGKVDGKLDKALEDSFPGSDPVSFLEAGPIKEGDLPLPTVKGPKASRSAD
jgi:hypothetical protein